MQKTTDLNLQHQIKAGTVGRKQGHWYEDNLANCINNIPMPYKKTENCGNVVFVGLPHFLLLNKVLSYLCWEKCDEVKAYATGRLATAENGDKVTYIEGKAITSTKSDIVIVMRNNHKKEVVGISVKQCNNKTPTNAQVFFTTAEAFYNLLSPMFDLGEDALKAMKQFCGDAGFRPLDSADFDCSNRISTPERYFWEEIDDSGRKKWEQFFKDKQDYITRLLLTNAYPNDPFPPKFILHKTKKSESDIQEQEIALFEIEQFITLSKKYSSFNCNPYRVKKGRYKEPKEVSHQAPRFGVIQMQRGGQKQHPTQLQFNLKAGYFYDLDKL